MSQFLQAHPMWVIPIVLVAILAASVTVYWLLALRATTQQRWIELSDWAARNRMKLHGEKQAHRPEVVDALWDKGARVLLSLHDKDSIIVQVEVPAESAAAEGARPMRWNLLVRHLEQLWEPTGLRPTVHAHSILDLLPLQSLQAMTGDRFTIYGSQSAAVRALARSSARALLPRDVGMLLVDHAMVLDFSTRPFDALELSRMDALAEQLVVHLPARRVEEATRQGDKETRRQGDKGKRD